MKARPRFCADIRAFSACADRFCPDGYRDPPALEEQIAMCGRTEGLSGVILQYPTVVNEENADLVARLTAAEGLEVAAVDAALSGREHRLGAFTNPDPKVRREAIETAKRAVDMARRLGTADAGLSLGQDGYDYLFQVEYGELWQREIEAVRELADHDPTVRLCVEYKLREPRLFIAVATAGKALHLFDKVHRANVGATVGIGHCLMARENPAESAALLLGEERLFSARFDDTYGVADDDMIAGSVHVMHTLEYLMVLQDFGYDGWYGLDHFPCREDLVRAAEISIANIRALDELAAGIDRSHLHELRAAGTGVGVSQYLHEYLYGPPPEGGDLLGVAPGAGRRTF